MGTIVPTIAIDTRQRDVRIGELEFTVSYVVDGYPEPASRWEPATGFSFYIDNVEHDGESVLEFAECAGLFDVFEDEIRAALEREGA
jgi:hypothetical protein